VRRGAANASARHQRRQAGRIPHAVKSMLVVNDIELHVS
jgi:hypothetical protein